MKWRGERTRIRAGPNDCRPKQVGGPEAGAELFCCKLALVLNGGREGGGGIETGTRRQRKIETF